MLSECASKATHKQSLALAAQASGVIIETPNVDMLRGVRDAAKIMSEKGKSGTVLRRAEEFATDLGLLKTEHQLNTAAVKVAEPIDTFSGWYMPKGGTVINGRKYTEHALERMAPKTDAVRDELSKRAFAKGLVPGTGDFKRYVNPRETSSEVVDKIIKSTQPVPGKYPDIKVRVF